MLKNLAPIILGLAAREKIVTIVGAELLSRRQQKVGGKLRIIDPTLTITTIDYNNRKMSDSEVSRLWGLTPASHNVRGNPLKPL